MKKNKPLKRHESLLALSHDHHKGLLLAQLLKKNAPVYRGLPVNPDEKIIYLKELFKNKLKPHFQKEEDILFKYTKGYFEKIDLLIADLVSEHESMVSMIKKLDSKNPDIELMDTFAELLEEHIRKEERILFEELQKSLSEEKLNDLGYKLKSF